MIIAIDIDDTITAMPRFFAILSRAVIRERGKVIIVSSRTNTAGVVWETEKELKAYSLVYSRLVMIEGKKVSSSLPAS